MYCAFEHISMDLRIINLYNNECQNISQKSDSNFKPPPLQIDPGVIFPIRKILEISNRKKECKLSLIPVKVNSEIQ